MIGEQQPGPGYIVSVEENSGMPSVLARQRVDLAQDAPCAESEVLEIPYWSSDYE